MKACLHQRRLTKARASSISTTNLRQLTSAFQIVEQDAVELFGRLDGRIVFYRGSGRAPVAAYVVAHDAEALRERPYLRVPHARVDEPAVYEHDRRAFAHRFIIEPRPVHLCEARFTSARLRARGGAQREQRAECERGATRRGLCVSTHVQSRPFHLVLKGAS